MRDKDRQSVCYQLYSMGYRPLDNQSNKWAKPVGYSIYFFDTISKIWTQNFAAVKDGHTCTFSKIEWDDEDNVELIDFLAYVETWRSHKITGEGNSRKIWNFHTKDIYEFIL